LLNEALQPKKGIRNEIDLKRKFKDRYFYHTKKEKIYDKIGDNSLEVESELEQND